nr:MAG TPA: hypothetical protein [Caudoviricetes sp.]
MAYATVADLESAWREVSAPERPRLEQMLEDASAWLDGQMAASGTHAGAAGPEALRLVSCNLVRRAMGELDPTQAEARWQTLTEPEAQWSVPAVVRSDFYLTQWERRLLGVRTGRACFSGGGE